jgi:intracellular sulfur oxidation DsrE/DsrF family protein
MKKLLVLMLAVLSLSQAKAQYTGAYKIIFQLTSADTLAHKSLMKQISNITSVAPQTQIEVVCHGPGLDMLVANKSRVADKIRLFTQKGVKFNACEFSMKERNVSKDNIIPEAGFVQAGILEIVSKQQEGWNYIKAGF